MDQQKGQFGHMGLVDLTVRPDANARIGLLARTVSGKKGFLAKLRSLVKPSLNSMTFSVPGMDLVVPARGPIGGSQGQKVTFERAH